MSVIHLDRWKLSLGTGHPLVVIAGVNVLENVELALTVGRHLQSVTRELGLPFVFKASFDKANRSSIRSYRGPGLSDGLVMLDEIKRKLDVPIATDIHDATQAKPVAAVADVLQIPAFLCRQTDLLLAAGRTGKVVNIKKGQFVAPQDMRPAVDKVLSTGNDRIILTERGSSFGYNNLVVDMRGLRIMSDIGFPVVFDATHSVQLPSGAGGSSGGQPQFISTLASAASAVGIQGLFVEVHDHPEHALSDGANALRLDRLEALVTRVRMIHQTAADYPA